MKKMGVSMLDESSCIFEYPYIKYVYICTVVLIGIILVYFYPCKVV